MVEGLDAAVRVLECGLRDGRGRGRGATIAELRAGKLGTYSSHPIWRLDVTLSDGERLPVIFKALQPDPRKAVHREVLLYERLLAGGRFGAPLLYASVCDDARDRYWLFVEDVGNWRLDWCDVDGWEPAFRCMARMHAAYDGREEELAALGCLSEHGSAFYRGLAAGARRSLLAHGKPAALGRFDHLADRYLEPSIAYLAAQPRTLVHGDWSCHNVMVQRTRIRPVDWEWAAAGVAGWDVAKLLDGWGPRKPRFLSAYLDELTRHVDRAVDADAFQATLTHCTVMQKLWYLRWWIEPCHDPAFVDRLLDTVGRRWEDAE